MNYNLPGSAARQHYLSQSRYLPGKTAWNTQSPQLSVNAINTFIFVPLQNWIVFFVSVLEAVRHTHYIVRFWSPSSSFSCSWWSKFKVTIWLFFHSDSLSLWWREALVSILRFSLVICNAGFGVTDHDPLYINLIYQVKTTNHCQIEVRGVDSIHQAHQVSFSTCTLDFSSHYFSCFQG